MECYKKLYEYLVEAQKYLGNAEKECPVVEINSSIHLAQDEISRALAKYSQLTGLNKQQPITFDL